MFAWSKTFRPAPEIEVQRHWRSQWHPCVVSKGDAYYGCSQSSTLKPGTFSKSRTLCIT
jgi:hypothetical protein